MLGFIALSFYYSDTIRQARNKAWFGIIETFGGLCKSWTILYETAKFAENYMRAQGPDGVEDDDEEMEEAEQREATWTSHLRFVLVRVRGLWYCRACPALAF